MAEGSRSSQIQQSSAPAHSLLVRLLVPSIGDVIFVALLWLLIATPLSVRLLGDAGIGWHIRTGQQIAATHEIPRVDSFSSTMSGKPWFAWEWLYELVVGQLESKAGLNGVVLFPGIVIAAVFAWTFRLLIKRGTNVPLAVILVLLAASASMIHFLARPHVVSWLFTLVCFSILGFSETGHFHADRVKMASSRLWLLPVVMLLWVNVHGGFLVGFVLLGICWIDAAWCWWRSGGAGFDGFLQKLRAARRIKELTVVGVIAALATLVNPYGWKLHAHICAYLSNRFLMDHIDEFQSPNFHGVAERCFAALLLIALISLAARRQDIRLGEGLVILFSIYSGLYASRNIPVASILLVLIGAPLLSDPWRGMIRQMGERLHRKGSSYSARFFVGRREATLAQRVGAIEQSLGAHVWPILAVLAASVIAAHGGRLGTHEVMNAHFDDKRFPQAAVSYLEKNDVSGPVISLDSWGGYLIYRLYPRVKVVVDDRHDLYGERFFRSYLKMVRVEPGWSGFVREHEARCILLPKGSSLANILLETQDWETAYADNVAILFIPHGVDNSPLRTKPTTEIGQRVSVPSGAINLPSEGIFAKAR